MDYTLQTIAQKRQRLIAEVASQRILLAKNADSLRKPLAIADKTLNVLRYLKYYPIIVAGTGAALLSIGKLNGIPKWLKRTWFAWQLSKKIINK